MERINIIYIDDEIDMAFDAYLDGMTYAERFPDCEFTYQEIEYPPENGYEWLLKKQEVKGANIVFVDSMLFKEDALATDRISGEEVKMVLKMLFPYIEVIVITQNGEDLELGTVAKYNNKKHGSDKQVYYSNCIPDLLQTSIVNIKMFRRLAEKLGMENNWEKALKERALFLIQGITEYDTLTAKDITNFINVFKEIQRRIDG